jgi:methylated-DNA-[protein]-cysteine S-methyltransferase
MENKYQSYYESEIGFIEITSNDSEILSIKFTEKKPEIMKNSMIIEKCITELDEYFKGKRMSFSLNLRITGTIFQGKVWRELLKIPYGETRSYQDIAAGIGNPKAVRAVGNANHNNNFLIMVPCHRVKGKNGRLAGFGAGIWRQEWLLDHEKKYLNT